MPINDDAGQGTGFLRFPSFISIKGLFPGIWKGLENFCALYEELLSSYIFSVSRLFITQGVCVSAHARQLHAMLQMAAIISLLRPRWTGSRRCSECSPWLPLTAQDSSGERDDCNLPPDSGKVMEFNRNEVSRGWVGGAAKSGTTKKRGGRSGAREAGCLRKTAEPKSTSVLIYDSWLNSFWSRWYI